MDEPEGLVIDWIDNRGGIVQLVGMRNGGGHSLCRNIVAAADIIQRDRLKCSCLEQPAAPLTRLTVQPDTVAYQFLI